MSKQLLEGLKVVDVSTVIAAPFAAGLLADFGADVVKVEMPAGGDPFRRLGPYKGNEGLRWPCMGRNKRCITLDLRKEEGKQLFLKLIADADVLIENFRMGTLDKWGLDKNVLAAANPKLIIARVTGYGQTGPYSKVAGFGTPATAFSGMTYITGYKDRAPVSPSFSLVDYVTGLYTAMSVMMAIYHRDQVPGGKAQEIDLSLYEGIFRMMEILVAAYDQNGIIRERTPKLSGTSSPGGTYETKDGKWVVLVCSTDRTYEYLTNAMQRPELLTDPRFNTMKNRVQNDAQMDQIVSSWIKSLDYKDLKTTVDREGVPVSLIFNAEDIFNDPHYAARNDIVQVDYEPLGQIKMPGIFPVFSETPGAIKWAGPKLGAHNEAVYCGELGLIPAELEDLKVKGVI